VAGFRTAHETLVGVGARFDAALTAVSAQALLPGHPDLRAMTEEARDLLERLGARPDLERLGTAGPDPAPSSREPAAASVEVA
jgi:hypothetical protein